MLKRLRLKMKARMTAQVKKLNIMLCGDVYNIFTGYNLRFFIENTMSDRAIIRYHQVCIRRVHDKSFLQFSDQMPDMRNREPQLHIRPCFARWA